MTDYKIAPLTWLRTKFAELNHTHSQYLTSHQDISGKEDTSNKLTSLQSLDDLSTDTQYPSAKLVYTYWSDLNDTLQNNYPLSSDLGAVAFSNDYTDLDNLPSLGNLAFENDVDLSGHDLDELSDNTNLLFSGDYTDLDNKPTIPTQTSQLTNNSGFITSSSLSNYLQQSDVKDNLTSTDTNKPLSAKQGKVLKTSLDGKANSSHNHDDRYYTETEIDNKIITDVSGLTDNQGLLFSGDYNDLDNKPSIPSKTSDLQNDSGFLTSHQSLSGYLQTSDVKDNLTSTDIDKPLSAKQGKELKTLIDSKEDNIEIFNGSVVRTSSTSAFLKAYTTSSILEGKIILYKVPNISSIEWATNVALDYYMNNQTSTFYRKYVYKNDVQLTFGDIESNSWILLAYNGTISNGQWNLISSSSYVETKKLPTNIIDMIYPIGSIYMSVNSINPSLFIGGTWEQIQDKFLLASGSTYSAGTTGGSATVTLTANQSGLKAHGHGMAHTHSHSHGFGDGYLVPKHKDNWGYSSKMKIATSSSGTAYYYPHSSTNNSGITDTSGTASNAQASSKSTTDNNTASNASESHENMPPYLAVYMWKRIA